MHLAHSPSSSSHRSGLLHYLFRLWQRVQRQSEAVTLAAPRNPLIPASRYPSALPCDCLYDLYPEEIGPTGNAIITDAEAFEKWKLVGRPVSVEEAEEKGGCVTFVDESGALSSETAGPQPLYLSLVDSDDEVFGRAAYISRDNSRRESTKKSVAAVAGAD